MYKDNEIKLDAVVVKWSACLTYNVTIRIRIPQKLTVFVCKICVWKERKQTKEAGVGPVLKMKWVLKGAEREKDSCTEWRKRVTRYFVKHLWHEIRIRIGSVVTSAIRVGLLLSVGQLSILGQFLVVLSYKHFCLLKYQKLSLFGGSKGFKLCNKVTQ